MSTHKVNADHTQIEELKKRETMVQKYKQLIEKTEEEIESVHNKLARWKSYSENKEDLINSTTNSLEKTERQIRSIYSDDTLSSEEYGVMYDILTNLKLNHERFLDILRLSPDDFNYEIREIEDYLDELLSRLEGYEAVLQQARMELEKYQLHE